MAARVFYTMYALDDQPRTCSCGHQIHEHYAYGGSGLSSLPGRDAASQNNNRGSASDRCDKIFGKEVNDHLNAHFPSSLPGCTFSGFRTREVPKDDGQALVEIDTFGYILVDSLQEGKETKPNGIYLIEPDNIGDLQRSATSTSDNRKKSPGAQERKLDDKAEKYVIGETYSGENKYKVQGKVKELEKKIVTMVNRHKEKHGRSCSDVTSLVGAAIMALTSGSKARGSAADSLKDTISNRVKQDKTPYLWRLAHARRLFLVVLSQDETAVTSSFRFIASSLDSNDVRMQSIDESLQSNDVRMDSIDVRMQSIDEILQSIGESLQKLCPR